MVALDTRTGGQRWRSPTGETGGQTAGVNLIVANGVVVVPDNGVYAFDAASGAPKWNYQASVGYGPGYFNIITDSVRVYTGSPSGYAYAVDLQTGAQIWATRVSTDSTASNIIDPVVDQGLVIVTMRRFTVPNTGGVIALDAATGAIRWRREFTAASPEQPSSAGGRCLFWQALVIAAADDGTVYGLDRTTGAIVWTSPRPKDEPALGDLRQLGLVAGTVIVGSGREKLDGLDPSTGASRWELNTHAHGEAIFYPLVGDATRVYATTTFLDFIAVDAATGSLAWAIAAGGNGTGFVGYPAIDADHLYVSGASGFWAFTR